MSSNRERARHTTTPRWLRRVVPPIWITRGVNMPDRHYFAVLTVGLLAAINIPVSCGQAEGGYYVRNESTGMVAATFTNSASVPAWYAIAPGATVYAGTHPTTGYAVAIYDATCRQIWTEPARAGGGIVEVSAAEPNLSVSVVAAPTDGTWDPGPQTADDQRATCQDVFDVP